MYTYIIYMDVCMQMTPGLKSNENSKHINLTAGITVHKFVGYTLNNYSSA